MDFIGVSLWTFLQAVVGGFVAAVGVLVLGYAALWVMGWYDGIQDQIDRRRDL